MSDEERQRQMDFILEQQAQSTVDVQRLQEAQPALLEMQAGTEQIGERLDRIERLVVELAAQLQGGRQQQGDPNDILCAPEIAAEMRCSVRSVREGKAGCDLIVYLSRYPIKALRSAVEAAKHKRVERQQCRAAARLKPRQKISLVRRNGGRRL